jgi:hypothetical protein
MKCLIPFIILCFLAYDFQAQEEIIIDNQFESGTVVNGYKRGVWDYFDHSGEMVLKINYDMAKVMYIKPTTRSFYLFENDEWGLSSVDKPPMYIGSQNEIDDILSSNIQYPKEALKSVRSGKTIVSMVIAKDGSAGQFEVVKDFGKNAGQEVIRALEMIPDLWIPATKNEKVMATKLYFSVIFEAYTDLEDEQLLPKDPEIPAGTPTLNVAPSVAYFKTFRIKVGNGMEAPTKKM